MLNTLRTLNWKTVAGVAVFAALVAGCGSNNSADTPPVASTDISVDVSALVAYVERLISADGNSDGVDVNAVTLVQDERSEPSPVSF